MANSTQALFEECQSLGVGSIGAAYTAVGSKTTAVSQIIMVNNLTDAPMMFSFDGTTDHFPIAAGGGVVLDLTTNKESSVDTFGLPIGTILYVKQISAPSTGSVYFSAVY